MNDTPNFKRNCISKAIWQVPRNNKLLDNLSLSLLYQIDKYFRIVITMYILEKKSVTER